MTLCKIGFIGGGGFIKGRGFHWGGLIGEGVHWRRGLIGERFSRCFV